MPYDDVLEAIKHADLKDVQHAIPAAIAKAFEDQVCAALIFGGWGVARQVIVKDRGDGHVGYIDLVAEKGLTVVAIELDATFPRDKSIRKLRQFGRTTDTALAAALLAAGRMPRTYRVIGLRKGHRALSLPDGIDALCCNVPPRCYGRKPNGT